MEKSLEGIAPQMSLATVRIGMLQDLQTRARLLAYSLIFGKKLLNGNPPHTIAMFLNI